MRVLFVFCLLLLFVLVWVFLLVWMVFYRGGWEEVNLTTK